jgi:hypothetical protein
MNNFDLCRHNLHERLRIEQQITHDPVLMQREIRKMTVALTEITEKAKPRLIMGGIRYASKWKHKALMDYMQHKFNRYRKSGNFEMLIDLLNFIAIESVLKTHPRHHLKEEDRK